MTEDGDHVQVTHEHELLLTVFTDLANELRSRREPEHLYTAAAIGSFGAIAWGVAALAAAQGKSSFYPLLHTAFVAALGSVIVEILVILKIKREHREYAKLREHLGEISRRLPRACGLPAEYDLPLGLTSGETGPGYTGSVRIVEGAAFAAVIFCLAVWFLAH